MSGFLDVFPSPQAALDLEPEDLAGLLVEFFNALDWNQRPTVMRTSFVIGPRMVPAPCDKRYEVQCAVIEAWCWLIREGLLIPKPDGEPDQYVFSRRGELKTRVDVKEYRRRAMYPKQLLHPTVVCKAWPLYVRGDYDTAVFQAFKEIEVAVRNAGGYTDADFGKELMRKAFRPSNESPPGPLSDSSEPQEEQKSLQELFAGAYGRIRNPTAHRHGVLTDPMETFEMLVMASHLLRVIDRRQSVTETSLHPTSDVKA